jgi:hypothetical protein
VNKPANKQRKYVYATDEEAKAAYDKDAVVQKSMKVTAKSAAATLTAARDSEKRGEPLTHRTKNVLEHVIRFLRRRLRGHDGRIRLEGQRPPMEGQRKPKVDCGS